MMKFYKSLLIITFTIFFKDSFSQNISPKDTAEIKLVAKRKIENSLSDLLNYLTSGFDGDALIQENIKKSYSVSNTQVFFDKETIIEDDINPLHTDSKDVQDSDANKYLNNLDLLYTKNEESTITFSDIKTSNVKKTGDVLYIKVYFSSLFSGKHKSIATPYQQTQRLAELRLDKSGRRWTANIMRLAFAVKEDSATFFKNDVVITRDSSSMQSDSIANAIALKKELDEQTKLKTEFDKILANADEAFNAKEYDFALIEYDKAITKHKEEYGKIFYIQLKISRAKKGIIQEEEQKKQEEERKRQEEERRKQEEERKRQEQLTLTYKKYISDAKNAERRRYYAKALQLYQAAFSIKPDSSINYEPSIKFINEKIRIKTEFDEMFVAGNYKELKERYDKILKINKEDSDYFLGRAKCYIRLGDPKKALVDFDQSIVLDYANTEALSNRAELHIVQNNLPKAIADYSSFLNIERDSASIYVKRAMLRIRTNNTKGAFEDFDKALDLDPDNADYFYERGMLSFNNNDFNKSLKDFSEAIDSKPNFILAWYQRGLTFHNLKKLKESGDDFGKARNLGLDADLVRNYQNLSALVLTDGDKELSSQKTETALAKYIEATLIQQDNWLAWYKRGECYYILKKYETAIENYTQAIFIRKDYDDAFYKRGMAKYQLNQFAESIADFQRTNELTTNYYLAMFAQGNANMQLKEYKAAIPWYQKIKIAEKEIEKAYPKTFFASTHCNIGISMYFTKYFTEALADLTSALKLNEQFPEAYYYRGLVYSELSKYPDAIDDFEKSIQLEPQKYEKHTARGSAFYLLDKFVEASSEFSNAIKYDTTQKELHYSYKMRAGANFRLEKYSEAIEDYLKAKTIDSSKCDTWFYKDLGIANLMTNQTENAFKALTKSLVADPTNIDTEYALACYYLQKKEDSEALKVFDKVFQTKKITNQFVKKDKLLTTINKSFRDNKEFRELVKKHLR